MTRSARAAQARITAWILALTTPKPPPPPDPAPKDDRKEAAPRA